MPARVDGDVKEGLLKLVDDAVAASWAHTRACHVLGVDDVRVHCWRARLAARGTLVDLAPPGNPVHRLLAWEEQAIFELIERWGPIDRSHRKLAHRGSYTGTVFVSPSSVLRVAANHEVSLPGEPPRPAPAVPWERNRIWIWDASHFTRARRVAYAIVVTRYCQRPRIRHPQPSAERGDERRGRTNAVSGGRAPAGPATQDGGPS